MRQFDNYIEIVPLMGVDKILVDENSHNVQLVLKQGVEFEKFFTDSDVVLDNKEKTKNGNIYFQQGIDVAIQLTEKQKIKYNGRKVVVKLFCGDEEKIWGTRQFPVNCNVVGKLNNSVVNLSCDTIYDIL